MFKVCELVATARQTAATPKRLHRSGSSGYQITFTRWAGNFAMGCNPALVAGQFGAPRTIIAQLAALLVRLLLKRMDLVHDETWPVQQPEKRHCKQGAYHHGHPRPLPPIHSHRRA